MISIIDVILGRVRDEEYDKLSEPYDQVYESWGLMGEMLDPNKAYDYRDKGKGIWVFEDRNDITYFARLTFQPTEHPFYEFKIGWLDKGGMVQYHQQSKEDIEIDFQRSDTIAKIYRDEVIPLFTKSELSGEMKVIPLKEDPARYNFFLKMTQKFPIPNTSITEDKYKCITIKKNDFIPKKIEVDNPYK